MNPSAILALKKTSCTSRILAYKSVPCRSASLASCLVDLPLLTLLLLLWYYLEWFQRRSASASNTLVPTRKIWVASQTLSLSYTKANVPLRLINLWFLERKLQLMNTWTTENKHVVAPSYVYKKPRCYAQIPQYFQPQGSNLFKTIVIQSSLSPFSHTE